jgi:hypothetical protein
MRNFISVYFFGGYKRCEIFNYPKGRYICTADGFDIYDLEEFDEKYIAVKS